MKRKPLWLARLCPTSHVEDEELRSFMRDAFGDAPALVISVSDETFEYLQGGKRRGVLGAALRLSEQGGAAAVFLLQFTALQLRCIVSLGHELFVELIEHARLAGCVNIVLEHEERAVAMQAPVDERDVEMLAEAARAHTVTELERLVADAAIAGADCRELDELPSALPDVALERVEVSVVALQMRAGSSTGSGVVRAPEMSVLSGTERVEGGKRFSVH